MQKKDKKINIIIHVNNTSTKDSVFLSMFSMFSVNLFCSMLGTSIIERDVGGRSIQPAKIERNRESVCVCEIEGSVIEEERGERLLQMVWLLSDRINASSAVWPVRRKNENRSENTH